jgi:hypothetical protein
MNHTNNNTTSNSYNNDDNDNMDEFASKRYKSIDLNNCLKDLKSIFESHNLRLLTTNNNNLTLINNLKQENLQVKQELQLLTQELIVLKSNNSFNICNLSNNKANKFSLENYKGESLEKLNDNDLNELNEIVSNSKKKIEEEQRSRKSCKICYELESTVSFLPCGHIVCCKLCAEKIIVCVMCREPIEKRIEIRYS